MRESLGLMGLPAPAMGYEGMVQTPSGPMPVEDGVLAVGGRKLNVSKDGTVTDERDQPIARVVNGQLQPAQQGQPAAPQEGMA